MEKNKSVVGVYELINCGVKRTTPSKDIVTKRSIICIEYLDGTFNFLDPLIGLDITSMEDMAVVQFARPKRKYIFKDVNGIAKKRSQLFGCK